MSSLTFEETGSPAAPVVLLLHGFTGSRRDWAPVAHILASTHRCIAVDIPGHGATGNPADQALWTAAGCVAALAGLLAGAGGGSVVGYSLGGRLALQLVIEHPGVATRAVIISSSPGIADEPARQARRGADELRARTLETQGLEPFLDGWYRQPLFATLRERPGFAALLERRRHNDPLLLARSLRTIGAGSQRSLWGDLPGLRTPLLFLAGERDTRFTALALDAVALCPQAEAVILRGAGHALVEEDAAAVARETLGFLSDRPRPRLLAEVSRLTMAAGQPEKRQATGGTDG